MADALLNLAEYKALAGVDPTNTRDDVRVAAMLDAVSELVRKHCDRTFEVAAGTPAARKFAYDGSGVLDIDDCTAITAVETDAGTPGAVFPLVPAEYTPQPADDPIFYWILIHAGSIGISPEMGFSNNLDTYEGFYSGPSVTVTVTGLWGWPEVPADVKLAAAWTIKDWVSNPGGADLTSEGIAGYSRSWASKSNANPLGRPALSGPARDILANYQRIT